MVEPMQDELDHEKKPFERCSGEANGGEIAEFTWL
jgi:hypothetical protein